MPEPDLVSRCIESNVNALNWLLRSTDSIDEWMLVWDLDRWKLYVYLATEADRDHAGVPPEHRATVMAALATTRRKDEVPLFVLEGRTLTVTRIERARIEREVGPPYIVDARNHFPMPFPREWRGPYALDIPDTYRIDTPDCQALLQVAEEWDYDDLDLEHQPRHAYRLLVGITRAMDSALATDDQIAAITSRFRYCEEFVERTDRVKGRHPSRRIFAAEIGDHRKGMEWPEILPLPETMLGPPPGWDPVGSFRDRPLVFRIDGTKLLVEWAPPAGVEWIEAATGRAEDASRFVVRTTTGRKPTDDEVGTVFAMLGGAKFEEEKGARGATRGKTAKGAKGAKRATTAKGAGGARVFRATAGWLRRATGRPS